MKSRTAAIQVDDTLMKEVWFAMGYAADVPDQLVSETALKLARRIVPIARLRYMYDIVPARKLSPTTAMFGDRNFKTGGIISSYLDGMTEACVFVATAGAEFDSAVREINVGGDILADFIADAIGSALAERAVSILEQDLTDSGVVVSQPYSPGYCGWDIREQHQFFTLFPPNPCGINLSESSLMSPEKSVSGFFAMGKNIVKQPYHCEICQNKSCFKRRNASRYQ